MKLYVPILKWKRGEQLSLELIPAGCRAQLRPLFEVVPSNRNPETGEPSTAFGAHIDNVVQAMVIHWGIDRPFFLDWQWMADEDAGIGQTPGEALMNRVNQTQLMAIPVAGLQMPPVDQATAVANAGHGICLRLTAEDFEDGLAESIESFLEANSLELDRIDLIVDLGIIENANPAMVAANARLFINSIPRVAEFRSLILAGSAYPQTRAGIESGESVPRIEWNVWQALRARPDRVNRMPSFGDYGVQSPGLTDFDFRFMTPSAAIRYTLRDEWLFIKGGSLRRFGFAQFRTLARQLVQRTEFAGADHCWGCQTIARVAAGEGGTGNLTNWVTNCTVHHLTVVVDALANLGGV